MRKKAHKVGAKGVNVLKSVVKLSTLEQIKAYSDPYRLKIVTFLRNHKEEATVKQIADHLGEVPAKIHYHIKKLEKAGIVELIRTQEVKGIIAKYYFLTGNTFEIVGDDINDEAKQVYKSQVLNIVNEYYDKSKEISMETMSENLNSGQEHKTLTIVFRDIYATEEEILDINATIRELLSKYDKKDSNKEPYHVFSALSKLINCKK